MRLPHALRQMLGVLLCLLAFGGGRHVVAQDAADLRAPEHRIKAAFLYKFGGYVEWPPSAFPTPTTPLTIGVIGAAPLATELQALVSGRAIDGRPVVVRVLQPGDDLEGVHVVFVGRSGDAALADVADLVADRDADVEVGVGHRPVDRRAVARARRRFATFTHAIRRRKHAAPKSVHTVALASFVTRS